MSQDGSNIETATDIGRRKKHKFLQTFTEDDFRDLVVRPIFERKGLTFLRDTCGPDEEGKDCIFLGKDLLGKTLVYAVQTKRGNLNLSSKVAENVAAAVVQVRTALDTDIHLTFSKEKVRPDRVLLVASGGINNQARRHIYDQVTDPRIQIMDVNDLIPMVDLHFPELWYGIDAQKFPYLRRLKEELLKSSDTIAISELGIEGKPYSPITHDAYVTLYMHRITDEITKSHGEIKRRPKLEQFPVAEIMQRRERIVCITGEGGSGKTTALRRLALQLADEALSRSDAKHLPILLNASEIGSSQRIVEVAAVATALLSSNDRPAFDTEDLKNGKLVILVDALDEISDETQRAMVLSNIEAFHSEFRECFVILTSRDYSSIQKLVRTRAFIRYQLSSIDLRQAGKIVDRLAGGKRLGKEDAKEMLRRLQDVHGISLNPMLVTVFVATSEHSKKDIPPNITEIFKKFTEMMLGRWDEKKGLAQQYQAPLKDFLLRQLALTMHRKKERSIALEKCQELMSEELVKRGYPSDVEVLSHEIIYRSNLLRVDDDKVEFRHHLLQEFFAGRGLPNATSVSPVVADEWWRKPIVFYFGDHPENHQGITELMEAATALKPTESFEAAVTIGLANQACYLAEISEKINTFEWVIRTFAASCEDVIASYVSKKGAVDLYMFIVYYLTGRDAVASDHIKQVADRIEANDVVRNEHEIFWCIAGLLEAGHLEKAEEMVKHFKPVDRRLLLALHLGAFFISNERISTVEQKRISKRICDRIAPQISTLIKATIAQWDSYLLELKDGDVRVIPKETETASESDSK